MSEEKMYFACGETGNAVVVLAARVTSQRKNFATSFRSKAF